MAFKFFATCARGTEDLLADELRALGAKKVAQDRGGVSFVGALPLGMRACLWLRTAQRVLLPIVDGPAPSAEALYELVHAQDWAAHLTTTSTFAVEATVKDSALTHSHFVSLKVKDAIADKLRAQLGSRPDVDTRHPNVPVVVHLAKDHASLSLDLAGAALHRRGYRVATTPAPLKETLAAALLLDAKWDGATPLHDPVCGSGTIAIEAALISMKQAPGRRRAMAFLTWPSLPNAERDWKALCAEADAVALRKAPAPITGTDFDDRAIEAARANVLAAGLDGQVHIRQADARRLAPLDPPGLYALNPPYAERIGQPLQVLGFYRQLAGRLAAAHGSRAVVLATDLWPKGAGVLAPERVRNAWNGPIEARIFHYALG